MTSFLTQCPGCVTSFRVTDAQLEAAEGMVRCGACLSVFSAPANRITLRTPVDPAQVPVLTPDAALEQELDAAGYDALAQNDDAEGAPFGDEAQAQTRAEDLGYADDDEDQDEDAAGLWIGDDRDRDVPLGDLDLNLHAHDHEDDDEFDDEEDGEEDEEDEESDAKEDSLIDDRDDALSDDDEAILLDAEEDEPSDEDDELADDEAEDFSSSEADEAYEPYQEDMPGEHEPEFRVVEEYLPQPAVSDDAEYEDDFDEDDDHAEGDDEYAEFATPGHRDDDDDVDTSRFAAPLNLRGPRSATPVDKRELREYLAALEDDDALEPLDDYDLDALSEPVTISERQTVRRTLRFMGLLVVNLVLIAVLVLQYVNANLDTLSRSQRLAPLMNRICQIVECPPPEQSDLGSLSSQDLLVRSHPRYAGALEVSFIFRNDAPDAQPFPAIELGFSDAAGQLIANRLFQPVDYLPPELQQLPAMPGQQTLQITLELADPGSEAVNYSIGFRAP